jgi:hypothetical protein
VGPPGGRCLRQGILRLTERDTDTPARPEEETTLVRPWLVGLVVLGTVMTGCRGGGGEVEVPDGWQTATFEGGSVSVPDDWQPGDPVGSEVVNLVGPDTEAGPGPGVRVRVTDRDAAPFDAVLQLAATSLAAQFEDLAQRGERDVDVPGAEEARVVEYSYIVATDTGELTVREQMLVAWYGEDRQLQLRVEAPEDVFDADREELETIPETVRLDEA